MNVIFLTLTIKKNLPFQNLDNQIIEIWKDGSLKGVGKEEREKEAVEIKIKEWCHYL
jgi:hypothetical protein